MCVRRDEEVVFDEATSAGKMARSFDNLISWLARENSFPNGVFLLTGTGIVPPVRFLACRRAIRVEITISGVGTLINPVVQG